MKFETLLYLVSKGYIKAPCSALAEIKACSSGLGSLDHASMCSAMPSHKAFFFFFFLDCIE